MKVVSAMEDRRVPAIQGTLFATHLFEGGKKIKGVDENRRRRVQRDFVSRKVGGK
jgi:hypothetical protein